MVPSQKIKPDMPVLCTDSQVAVVDHMEGPDTIKLKKDATGKHHFIPLSWVQSVDAQVHVDRTRQEVMSDWRTEK